MPQITPEILELAKLGSFKITLPDQTVIEFTKPVEIPKERSSRSKHDHLYYERHKTRKNTESVHGINTELSRNITEYHGIENTESVTEKHGKNTENLVNESLSRARLNTNTNTKINTDTLSHGLKNSVVQEPDEPVEQKQRIQPIPTAAEFMAYCDRCKLYDIDAHALYQTWKATEQNGAWFRDGKQIFNWEATLIAFNANAIKWKHEKPPPPPPNGTPSRFAPDTTPESVKFERYFDKVLAGKIK